MTTNNAIILQGFNDLLDAIQIADRMTPQQAAKCRGLSKKPKPLPKLSCVLPQGLIDELRDYCASSDEKQGHIVERALRLYLLIRRNRPHSIASPSSPGIGIMEQASNEQRQLQEAQVAIQQIEDQLPLEVRQALQRYRQELAKPGGDEFQPDW